MDWPAGPPCAALTTSVFLGATLDCIEQPETSLLSWIKAFLMMSVASREDPGVAPENGGNNPLGGRHWVFLLKNFAP